MNVIPLHNLRLPGSETVHDGRYAECIGGPPARQKSMERVKAPVTCRRCLARARKEGRS